jgi:aromatic ring-cleaving dioxygenase
VSENEQTGARAGVTTSASDPAAIAEYHAHVYYDPETTRDRAERLRARVAAEFPRVTLGRWHDELVGPHTRSMYQIAFPADLLASFLPWLMLNREGLSVLVHPETGDDYRDHSAHAARRRLAVAAGGVLGATRGTLAASRLPSSLH